MIFRLAFAWMAAFSLLASARAAEEPALHSIGFTLTDKELAELAQDRPVIRVTPDEEGDAAARIFGAVEIDAPRDVIWEIMLDCARAPEFVPGLTDCTIIETGADGRWDVREHRINFGFVFTNVVNVFRSEYIPLEQISFHLIGGDLKTQEGVWQLKTIRTEPARTRVLYDARLAIGRPVPRFLVRRSIRNDMPEVFRALKSAAEADAELAE
jgi:hypothetical protein